MVHGANSTQWVHHRAIGCGHAWPHFLALWAIALAGCGVQSPPLAPDGATTISVVLTFDDGPIPADIADPSAEDKDHLLNPLRTILATLAEYNAQGVFYIRGPGTPQMGETLRTVFADGLRAAAAGGNILGYHAYNHDGPAWGPPWNLDSGDETAMRQDLLDLKAYVAECLDSPDTGSAGSLTPVFRQPFGGGILRWLSGERVARDLGLTYHGYDIDSFDWTGNVDTDPWLVARLPVGTETEHLDFVRERLAEQAAVHRDAARVDVLLHINSFTAGHLGQILDELKTAFEEESHRQVLFEVPVEYLTESSPGKDVSVVELVL